MSNIALLDSVVQAIALQGSVSGGPSTTEANYIQFLANPLPPQIPNNESVTDESMVGDGYSRILRNVYNYYWQTRNFPVSGLLNDHIAAILINGFLGGTRSTTTPVGVVRDHATIQKSSSVTPSLFSIYRHLEGEKFLFADLFPNAFSISQEGEGQPTFNFDLLGTGKFLDSDLLATADFSESGIVAAPNYEYFHGAATTFTATDGTTTYDFTNQGTLISCSVEGNNGGRVSRRPGDTFFVPADRNSGAYARNIIMGKAQGHSMKLKIDLGTSLTEWRAMVQRKSLTGCTLKFVGFNKIGGLSYDYEFEISAPKARFGVISGDTDDQYGALALEIIPERDPISLGLFTARIRTDKLTTVIL